jgi:hypothetical protein
MSAETIGGLANFGLMALAGVYLTLLGFRVIGTPPGQNPQVDAHRAKWGSIYRIGGPALIAIGLVLGLIRLFGGR